MHYPERLLKLIRALAVLPGVGPKTAQKLAIFLVQHHEELDSLGAGLLAAKEIRPCKQCGNLAEDDLCPICLNPERNPLNICVLETPSDLLAIERSGEYHGVYHVLGGALNPLEGVGPEDLNIQGLFKRLSGVEEVILATAMTVEGEATAAYLADQLRAKGVTATRLAYGLPVGGALEYADEITLARALEHRRPFVD